MVNHSKRFAPFHWLLTLAISLVIAGSARADDPVRFSDEALPYDHDHPLAGFWVGQITVKSGMIFEFWNIERLPTGDWSATITSLHFGATGANAKLENVENASATISFTALNMAHRFEGKVSDDGQRLTGPYAIRKGDAAAGEKPIDEGTIELGRSLRVATLPDMKAFSGTIGVSGAPQIHLTVMLAHTAGGHWLGQVNIPAQGLHDYPLVNIEEDPATHLITAIMPIPRAPAGIQATIAQDGSRFTGRFKQAGYDLPLDLKRDSNPSAVANNRPQEPHPPFPYQTRDVSIAAPGGFNLAGTLSTPKGTGPFPAVVLITGSGQQDRDETLMGHKPFLLIADYLTRRGIAVLRCDDRGVGGSGGGKTLDEATTKDFADDINAMVDFLAMQNDIEAHRIGLIGHSEGGLIAPMVAAARNDVAFVVMLAGPGVTGAEILALQGKQVLKAEGASDEFLEQFATHQKKVLELAGAGAPEEQVRAEIAALLNVDLARKSAESTAPASAPSSAPSSAPAVTASMPTSTAPATAPSTEPSKLEPSKAQIDAQYQILTSPWMKFFLSYDPRPTLAKLKCPILAINGTLDLQVWHEQNLPEIEKAVHAGGGNLTIKRYENLNHLFQPAKTGGLSEYAAIETTMDEHVLHDMAEWIRSTLHMN
jgi:pimeloyl-ACP methyl ester carboxylesterase